jgi:mRNA interferase MazF
VNPAFCQVSAAPRFSGVTPDEIIEDNSKDFKQSGLKVTSVIRVGRLAVVSGDILLGAIGEISSERLNRVKNNLSNWLSEK